MDCLHDLTLAFFIAIIEALSVQRLARTQHHHSTKPEYLEWIREFQEHVVKAFTNPIWMQLGTSWDREPVARGYHYLSQTVSDPERTDVTDLQELQAILSEDCR